MWYSVDSVERFGKGWIVRYSIPSCCYVRKDTVVINQKKKPSEKTIQNAIENKR